MIRDEIIILPENLINESSKMIYDFIHVAEVIISKKDEVKIKSLGFKLIFVNNPMICRVRYIEERFSIKYIKVIRYRKFRFEDKHLLYKKYITNELTLITLVKDNKLSHF